MDILQEYKHKQLIQDMKIKRIYDLIPSRYKLNNYTVNYVDDQRDIVINKCGIGFSSDELLTFTFNSNNRHPNDLLDLTLYIYDCSDNTYIPLFFGNTHLLISPDMLLSHSTSDDTSEQTIHLSQLLACNDFKHISVNGFIIVQSTLGVPFADSLPVISLVDDTNKQLYAITMPEGSKTNNNSNTWLLGHFSLKTNATRNINMYLNLFSDNVISAGAHHVVGDANILNNFSVCIK